MEVTLSWTRCRPCHLLMCSISAPSDFVVYMFASSDPTHPPMRYSFATCTATAMGRSCHGNGKFRHLHATFPCRRHL